MLIQATGYIRTPIFYHTWDSNTILDINYCFIKTFINKYNLDAEVIINTLQDLEVRIHQGSSAIIFTFMVEEEYFNTTKYCQLFNHNKKYFKLLKKLK